jgi:hypothetical protein
MSTKEIKIWKNKKKQKRIRRIFVLFFSRSSNSTFIRLQVVGEVVLIHPAYDLFIINLWIYG